MVQIVSIAGALGILAAYAANHLRYIGPADLSYALLNFAGSGVLAAGALIEKQWGFLLLEGVWALVSLWAMVQLLRGEPARPDRP